MISVFRRKWLSEYLFVSFFLWCIWLWFNVSTHVYERLLLVTAVNSCYESLRGVTFVADYDPYVSPKLSSQQHRFRIQLTFSVFRFLFCLELSVSLDPNLLIMLELLSSWARLHLFLGHIPLYHCCGFYALSWSFYWSRGFWWNVFSKWIILHLYRTIQCNAA